MSDQVCRARGRLGGTGLVRPDSPISGLRERDRMTLERFFLRGDKTGQLRTSREPHWSLSCPGPFVPVKVPYPYSIPVTGRGTQVGRHGRDTRRGESPDRVTRLRRTLHREPRSLSTSRGTIPFRPLPDKMCLGRNVSHGVR